MAENINKKIQDAEERLEYEDDFSPIPPSDIVAFNELRSCADLVRMEQTGQLEIKPDFQRDIVWSNAAQTRFIDSLVKQLPIPSMCLSLDYKTEKRIMVDGLQRISSVIKFLNDKDWRLSVIDDVDKRLSGKTSGEIKDKYEELYTRVENFSIPVTVLRCNYSKKDHRAYLFSIFHRLNTAGNKLTNQEIRNCIYQGDFNQMLKDIVQNHDTRVLFGLEDEKSYRFKWEEFFLRIFAFSDSLKSYNGHLAKFLNEYMGKKRNIDADTINSLKNQIMETVKLLNEKISNGKNLSKLSKATMEAIFIGFYKNLEAVRNRPIDKLQEQYHELLDSEYFSLENLSGNLAAKDKVKNRINYAVDVFSKS